MLGTRKSQGSVRETGRGGHSGENSISGKTGIHFKISAQEAAGLFSGQAGRSSTPAILPTSLPPHGGPWPGSVGGDTPSTEARWEGRHPTVHSPNTRGGGKTACKQGPVPSQAHSTLPSPVTGSLHIGLHVTWYHMKDREGSRANTHVQHLRKATEMRESQV